MPLRVSIYILLLTLFFTLTSCNNGIRPIVKTPGEKIFRATCSSCHILPNPKYYSLETVLEQIEYHKLTKRIHLTTQQEEELIRYLQQNFK